MSSQTSLDLLGKPALVGLVAYGAARYRFPTGTIGNGYSLPKVIGLAAAVGSAATEVVHEAVIDPTFKDNRTAPLNVAFDAAANYGTASAVVNYIDPTAIGQPGMGHTNFLIHTGGPQVIVGYVWDMWKNSQ